MLRLVSTDAGVQTRDDRTSSAAPTAFLLPAMRGEGAALGVPDDAPYVAFISAVACAKSIAA